MNRKVWLVLMLSAVVMVALVTSVAAQSSASPQATSLAVQVKPDGKLSFRLAALANSTALRAASADEQARELSLAPSGPGSLMRDVQGRLLVYIRMTDLSSTQLQALTTAGAQIVNVADRYQTVTALVDAAQLNAIANLAAVQSVQEEVTPLVGNGTLLPLQADAQSPLVTCPTGIVSEGDTQLHAASARATYGISGTGVTVGILSDSYDQYVSAITHASNDVASGDLPGVGNPCGLTTAVGVISNSLAAGVHDEGRAMLQIVHDLAPGASLKFASAFNGLFAFGNNIRNLRAAGANIIADDVFYFSEPFFQEGPINVAISDVVSSGVIYFALAGNNNVLLGGKNVGSYEAPHYRPTACPAAFGLSGTCHDFDPGAGVNTGSAITLTNNGYFYLDFQYAEPWYGVTDDFDIYVFDAANNLEAESISDNSVTQMPYEILAVQNTTGSTQRYRIVINRFQGSGAPRLKYMFTQVNFGIQAVQYNTSNGGDIVGPTLYGHSSTRFGFSVAAAPYNDSTTPETYSSRGPAAHYFGPVVGSSPAAAISPQVIQQPDFTATDGGCSSFFGSFSSGCYRFFGTSAATPHAAAVGALLLQKANQLHVHISSGLMKFLLQVTAHSMSGGNVNSVGAGLLDALAATQKLVNLKQVFLPAIRR